MTVRVIAPVGIVINLIQLSQIEYKTRAEVKYLGSQFAYPIVVLCNPADAFHEQGD